MVLAYTGIFIMPNLKKKQTGLRKQGLGRLASEQHALIPLSSSYIIYITYYTLLYVYNYIYNCIHHYTSVFSQLLPS